MKKYLIFLILLVGVLINSPIVNAQYGSLQTDTSAPSTQTQTSFPTTIDNPVYTAPAGNSAAGGATLTPTPTVTSLPASQFGNVTAAPGATTYDTANGDVLPPLTINKKPSTCAQTDGNLCYTPLEPLPGVDYTNVVTPNGLGPIINIIFNIIIRVGALLAVLMLTIGGVQYMISGTAGGKNQGIARAKAALWGILLIAASWLILNTINPNLLSFNLNPCPGGVQGVNCGITGTPAPASTVSTATVSTISQDQATQLSLVNNNAVTVPTQGLNQATQQQFNAQSSTCTNEGGIMIDPTSVQSSGGTTFVCQNATAAGLSPTI